MRERRDMIRLPSGIIGLRSASASYLMTLIKPARLVTANRRVLFFCCRQPSFRPLRQSPKRTTENLRLESGLQTHFEPQIETKI
jgi:hypothetical protein